MKIKNLQTKAICMLIGMASFASCKIEQIEYKRFENLKVTGIKSVPSINFDIIYYNPNAVGCRLRNAACFVIYGDDTIATAFSDKTIRLNPYAEFSVPVSSYVASNAMIKLATKGLFSNADLPIDFAGSVTIQKFLFKKKFKFRVTEKFNKSQLFN